MGIGGIFGVNSEEYKIKEQQAIEEVVEDTQKEVTESNGSSLTCDFQATNEDELVEFNEDFDSEIQDSFEEKVEEVVEEKVEEIKEEVVEEKQTEETTKTTETTEAKAEENKLDISEFKLLVTSDSGLSKLAKENGIGALFDKLDTDHDGVISESELNKAGIKKGKSGSVSTVDLEKYLSDSFKVQTTKTTETKKTESKPKETKKATSTNSGGSVGGSYGGGSVGGSYGGGGGYSAPSSANSSIQGVDKNKSIDDQIKDLETQKDNENDKIGEKNKELSAVQAGTDSEIKSKKDAVDEAKTKYEEAADKDPQVKELKDQQMNKEEQINVDNQNIATVKEAIRGKEQDKFNKESEISSIKKQKSAQENSLSTLTVPEGADEDTKKAIEEQRNKIKLEIERLDGELEKANKELDTVKQDIGSLRNDSRHYTANKMTHEKERDELVKQIEEKCNDTTKAALDNYKKAQEDLENAKTKKTNAIKEEIEASRTKMTELDNKINELKTQKIEEENSVGFAGMNKEFANKLVDAAMARYGNDHTIHGKCATGVSNAYRDVLGSYPGKNGNNYGDYLSNNGWKEVNVEYDNLKSLPAGAIVTWKSYGQGASVQYGHVYISDGKGGQLCDRYDVPNGKDYNKYRLNTSHSNYENGKPYKVYIPIDPK